MDEWQELLQKVQVRPDGAAALTDGTAQDGSSLMQQVRELVGVTGPAAGEAAEAGLSAPGECFRDGYVRRSPVQEYVTPPDYKRKTIRKCVLIVLGVCFLALLVVALLRTGLLSFK